MPNNPGAIRLKSDARLIDDMARFAAPLMASMDIDPLYPVLRKLYQILELDTEQSLWFTALYLAYYNVASAYAAYCAVSMETAPSSPKLLDFPRATERRGNRGTALLTHLNSYVEQARFCKGQEKMVKWSWNDDPKWNYERTWYMSQTIYNNGRWAAFKWADLLKNVHGFNLAAPDMRMAFCTAPKAGLELLFPGIKGMKVSVYDRAGEQLLKELAGRGVRVPDWESLETILCNFHSLHAGRYYVGHDIDELLHTIKTTDFLPPFHRDRLLSAYGAVLPDAYIGHAEIDKRRMKAYQQTGEIVVRV